MRDVAAALGVSNATVSLALAGSPRISVSTRARVHAMADELCYVPHAQARSLATNRTHALGLVLGDVANPYFGELASAAEAEAHERGYVLMVCNADESVDKQDAYLSRLLGGNNVDGVLLVAAGGMTDGLRMALQQRSKIVCVDRPLPEEKPASVGIALPECAQGVVTVRADGRLALADAVNCLVDLGHRRFAVVTAPMTTVVGRERAAHVRSALDARGIHDLTQVEGDFRMESARKHTADLLSMPDRPTAILAGSHLMTLGVLTAIKACGLKIPDDISVVGYDDSPWLQVCDPPVSVVAQPVARVARTAVEVLVQMIEGGPGEARTFACAFVPRSSCGPAPGRDLQEHLSSATEDSQPKAAGPVVVCNSQPPQSRKILPTTESCLR